MNDEKVLDLVLLNDYRVNLGNEMLTQMLSLYIGQSEKYLADIEALLTVDDAQLWHERCHKLKGAASSAGLTELRSYVLTVEHAEPNSEEKAKIIKQLLELNNQGIAAFKNWLKTEA